MSFGVNVFSGSGCLAAAFALEGALSRRVGAVLRVYLLLILPGAALTVGLLPTVRAFVLPDFAVFAALILFGLSLELAGLNIVPSSPPPAALAGRWLWFLRFIAIPQVVLGVAVAVSVLRGLAMSVSGTSVLPVGDEPFGGLLAVFAGLSATLAGVLLSGSLRRWLDPISARRGGAGALALLGLMVLGVPIPRLAPMVALGLGLAVGALRRRSGGGGAPPVLGHDSSLPLGKAA